MAEMTSSRPYLLRAIYEWLADNGLTPQLVVDAGREGVEVPREYVKDGLIVLNVSPGAVRGLSLGNERIEFGARFAGTPRQISLPVGAVVGIHARETGVGMSFPKEDPEPEPPPSEGSGPARPARPSLRVVK
jgi:stringent starvation protein B